MRLKSILSYIIFVQLIFLGCTNRGIKHTDSSNDILLQVKTEMPEYKNNGFTGFYKLHNIYSDRVLIYAIDHIGRNEDIKNVILPFDIDYSLYDRSIDSLLVNRPDLLNELLDSVYLNSQRDILIKHVYNWCYTYTLLAVNDLGSDVYLEEVLYVNPYSKYIVESFFNHPAQDWGSLSSSQLSELPFRISSNFYKKDENFLLAFYNSFFRTVIQMNYPWASRGI